MKQDKSNIVDKGWVKMLPTLEKELPQKNKNHLLWFWFLGILLVGTMAYTVWSPSNSDVHVEPKQFASAQQSDNVAQSEEGNSAKSKSDAKDSKINKPTNLISKSNQKVIVSNEPSSNISRTTTSYNYQPVASKLQITNSNPQNLVEQKLQPQTSNKILAPDEVSHKIGAFSESVSSKSTASNNISLSVTELTPIELLPLTQTRGLFSEQKIPLSRLAPKVILPRNNGTWRIHTGIALMQGVSQNHRGLQVQGGLSRKWDVWQIGVMTSFGVSNIPSAEEEFASPDISIETADEFDVSCPTLDSNSLNSESNFIPLACEDRSMELTPNSDQGSVNLFGSVGIEMTYEFSPLFSLSAVSGMEIGSALNNGLRNSGKVNLVVVNTLFGQLDANFSISKQLSLFAGYRHIFTKDANVANPRKRGLIGIKYII